MKTIVIFFLLIIFFLRSYSNETFFDDLEYYRVNTNLKCTAYNGSSIVVFGDGGVIVRTTDGGRNWNQINLNDSFNIVSAVNHGLDYYAAVNKSYLLKSSDNGASWQHTFFGDSTCFYKIATHRSNLYTMNQFNILKLDQDLSIIKEYPISSDTAYYDFTINGDNLIYVSGHGKFNIINLINDKINFIDFQQLGICSDCPVPKNLFSDQNITYFNYFNDLYQFDGSNVSKIFTPVKKGQYTANKGDVYEIFNFVNEITNLDSLFFIKIDKNSQKYEQIKKSGYDRYISNLRFLNLSFITKDTILAVGKDKLIYMSFDRGINWELKSKYNNQSEYFLHDRLNANGADRYVCFTSTTDGGVTWLPQKNYDPYFLEEGVFSLNYTTFFRNKSEGFYYKHSYIKKDTNLIHTTDGCQTVKLINRDILIGWDPSKPFIPFNYGDLVMFAYPVQWGYKGWQWSQLYCIDRNMNVTRRSIIDSAWIIFMDRFEDPDKKNKSIIYSIIQNLKYPRKVGGDRYTYDSVYFSLISSIDTGATWNKEFDFFFSDCDTIMKGIYKIGNNILIAYQHTNEDSTNFLTDFYKLDINKKTLEKILRKEGYDLFAQGSSIAKIFNRTYLNGFYFEDHGMKMDVLVNDDFINDPGNWRSVSPTYRYGAYSLRSFKDSLVIIHAYDSLFNSYVSWFANPKFPVSVVDNVEKVPSIYLSSPNPNPAQDYVNIKVWWDMRYDVSDMKLKVYDILGNYTLYQPEYSLEKINHYSAYVFLKTSQLSTGTYFVALSLGGESMAGSFIIIR